MKRDTGPDKTEINWDEWARRGLPKGSYPWDDPLDIDPSRFKRSYICPSCKKVLFDIKDVYKFCPFCGSLLNETVTLEEIRTLLHEINAKVGIYLENKRRADEKHREDRVK